jgi:hypothetical protein
MPGSKDSAQWSKGLDEKELGWSHTGSEVAGKDSGTLKVTLLRFWKIYENETSYFLHICCIFKFKNMRNLQS